MLVHRSIFLVDTLLVLLISGTYGFLEYICYSTESENLCETTGYILDYFSPVLEALSSLMLVVTALQLAKIVRSKTGKK